jgi:hypothetical protein
VESFILGGYYLLVRRVKVPLIAMFANTHHAFHRAGKGRSNEFFDQAVLEVKEKAYDSTSCLLACHGCGHGGWSGPCPNQGAMRRKKDCAVDLGGHREMISQNWC